MVTFLHATLALVTIAPLQEILGNPAVLDFFYLHFKVFQNPTSFFLTKFLLKTKSCIFFFPISDKYQILFLNTTHFFFY